MKKAARAPARKARKARQRRSVSKRSTDRVRATERALREVGESRVRPGPIRVARSRWVSPSARGFGAESFTRTLDRISEVPADPFYSFTVRARFKGRDGKRKTVEIAGIGVPRMRDAKRLRKKSPKTGRLESTKQTLKRLVKEEIARIVFQAVRAEWGKYDLGERTSPMGRERARQELAKIKLQQGASFQVDFQRIVRRTERLAPKPAKKRVGAKQRSGAKKRVGAKQGSGAKKGRASSRMTKTARGARKPAPIKPKKGRTPAKPGVGKARRKPGKPAPKKVRR